MSRHEFGHERHKISSRIWKRWLAGSDVKDREAKWTAGVCEAFRRSEKSRFGSPQVLLGLPYEGME